MKIFPIIIGLFFINPLSLIAQLTFGGGNTSTRSVVKKTASEAPTPDDITQLLNEVTYLTYNAGFPVRMSNLSPKEASSLQKINQLGIVKIVSGGNGVYSLSTTTKGQTYFIEKQDETLIYGAALGKFNSKYWVCPSVFYALRTLEWSNGQVEGQVNRLKNIKRRMYGRASFELLKKMVLSDTS